MKEKKSLECDDGIVVSAQYFTVLRVLGLFILFLGNYLFLRDVQYFLANTHTIFFALPFALLGMFLLVITYMAIDRCYLGYLAIAFVLELIATFLYYLNTAVGSTFEEETAVYFLILIAMFIALFVMILSETQFFENRIISVIIGAVIGILIYYNIFLEPYIYDFITHADGFIFHVHAGDLESVFRSSGFDKSAFFVSTASFSFTAIALVSIPIYLFHKSNIKWYSILPFVHKD